jgi:hypothetical protein
MIVEDAEVGDVVSKILDVVVVRVDGGASHHVWYLVRAFGRHGGVRRSQSKASTLVPDGCGWVVGMCGASIRGVSDTAVHAKRLKSG